MWVGGEQASPLPGDIIGGRAEFEGLRSEFTQRGFDAAYVDAAAAR